MRVSQAKAKNRMERLTGTQWRGQSLVTELPRPDGMGAYIPGRALVGHEDVPPDEPPQTLLPRTAGREAVIAHSRAHYAKSRTEVEAQIGHLMGWDTRRDMPPTFAGDDPAVAEGKGRAFTTMTSLGVPREQALDLLARFSLVAIERQIAWLPHRGAKNPARFLMAAVEGDYEMPPGVRRQELLAAALREQNAREQGAQEQAQDGGRRMPPANTPAPEAAVEETPLDTKNIPPDGEEIPLDEA